MKLLFQNTLIIILSLLVYFDSYCGEMGATEIWIERVGPQSNSAFIGDDIEFRVVVNTNREKITGVAFFLTIDSEVLQPVLDGEGRPFSTGPFLQTANSTFNNTHSDSLHLPHDSNGIDGFQLDYYQSTGPASGNTRPNVQGSGLIATFSVQVTGFTKPGEVTWINFDRDDAHGRLTTYYKLNGGGNEENFADLRGFWLSTAGFMIKPPIPDKMIEPGDTLHYDLKNHIESSTDSLTYSWSYEIIDSIDYMQIDIDTSNILTVIADTLAHGLLSLKLTARQSVTGYKQSQNVKIGVNYPPYYIQPLPAVEFNEDEKLVIPKSDFFADDDDSLSNVTLNISANNIFVENLPDSLVFSAKTDWFGFETINCYLQDEILTIFNTSVDTTLDVTVNPVNDLPVLDLSELNPVILYHHTPKTLHMIVGQHVTDVDDVNFTWTVFNPDTSILKAEFSGSSLHLEAKDETFIGDTTITVTVTDAQNGSDSEDLTVKIYEIQTIPPVISPLPVIYKLPDSTYTLSLNDYVTDDDTPKSQLQWSFRVIDENTNRPDTSVYPLYNFDLQTLEISSRPKHHVIDRLTATVTDDASNSDTESTRLLVFGRDAPLVVPFHQVVMMIDTTIQAIDLDTMAYDLKDNPENLSWRVIGVDSLEKVTISAEDKVVSITSNATFIGTDVISFIATNSMMGSDTAHMIVRVVPRTPNPIFIPVPDATFFWREPIPQPYVNLDEYVWDIETPDSLIKWKMDYDTDYFNLFIDDNNTVRIITNERTGSIDVTFTATDSDSNSSVETATFHIVEDAGPAWKTLKEVTLPKGAQITLYKLVDKCSDDRTPTHDLIFGFESESPPKINIEIEPEVTISLRDTSFLGTTWIQFSAEDAHGHKTWSNVVDVITGKSQPPVWRQIPTIQFENNEIYRELFLRKYSYDPENQRLAFSVTNTHPNELNVQLIDSTSQVYFAALRGFFGKSDIVFNAIDRDSNITSTVIDIIVTDTDPPEGSLTYHYNPITSHRINFIVISDATTTEFKNKFIVNSHVQNSLDFKLMDSDMFQKIWASSYKFTEPGNYTLKIELINGNNLVNEDSLNWTIRFGGMAKGSIRSFNKKLTVTYPENNSMMQRHFILMESSQNDHQTDLPIYSIKSDDSNNDQLLALHSGDFCADRNYSFYQLLNNDLNRIDTYIDIKGNFHAKVEKNSSFIFSKSETPAVDLPLPENVLFAYPNPFNHSIKIKFYLENEKNVSLRVYNIMGQTVFSKKFGSMKQGLHSITWDGQTHDNIIVPSGIYIICIDQDNQQKLMKKVTLIK